MSIQKIRTLVLAGACLMAVLAADADAAKSPTEQWILACQNKDGGFGLYPGDGSNLLGTYAAVHSLKLLNAKVPEAKKVAAFILTKRTPEGGFCNRFGVWPDQPVLQMTFYAVKTLATLQALPADKAKIAAWIHAQQQKDGGYLWDYWMPPEDPAKSSTRSSYYAVEALALLDEKPRDAAKTAAYLSARQTNSQWKDGSFNERDIAHNTETPGTVGLVWFTGLGLSALKTLQAPVPMADKALAYLTIAQRKDGGIGKGLSIYHCYDDRDICRMQEAYYAAMGLSVLNGQFKDGKALSAWIKSCLKADGGYARRPALCPTDAEATFQALSVLAFLKEPFPAPQKPVAPVREPDAPAPKFLCEQVNAKDPDDSRYLFRIAKPIYDQYIGQGEFAVALALLTWCNDNLLFCSNYSHSASQTIIDGLATCGPHGRSFTGLANSVGLEARVLHIDGHGLAECRVNGKWVMIDPMFVDWGRNEKGEPQSALRIHENLLDRGRYWTRFGDWRYEKFSVEQPDGEHVKVLKGERAKEAFTKGAYTPEDY